MTARWQYRYENNGKYCLTEAYILANTTQCDFWEIVLYVKKVDIGVIFECSGNEKCWYSEGGSFSSLSDALCSPYLIPRIDSMDLNYYLPLLPNWVGKRVLYEIFVDRFRKHELRDDLPSWQSLPPQNDFYHKTMFGGSIQGIIHSIVFDGSYLQQLGIGAIYLTPVFSSPSSHKYDTDDYYSIDKSFGDLEDLKDLVTVAHNCGIKVILDGVFNHCSDRLQIEEQGVKISLFQDLKKHPRTSKYHNWVFWESDTSWRGFADLSHIPVLNTSYNKCAEYLSDVAAFWSKALNIDGWRLDVANELSPYFIELLRKKLQDINSQMWLFGEILHNGNRWIRNNMLSGITNHHWREYIIKFLAGEWNSIELDTHIQQLWFQYPSTIFPCLVNYLSNHDTSRIMTIVEGENCYDTRIKLCEIACVLLFTSIGTPMIYYGDEIGMEGYADPDCRRCMEWDTNYWNEEQKKYRPRLLSTYKKMIELRNRCPWLADGIWSTIISGEGKTYVYKRLSCSTLRSENDNVSEVIVLINAGEESPTLQLGCFYYNEYTDVITGEPVVTDGIKDLDMQPFSFRVFAHLTEL